jgi:hypothetical protein
VKWMDQVLEIALERMPHPAVEGRKEGEDAQRPPESGGAEGEVSISAH